MRTEGKPQVTEIVVLTALLAKLINFIKWVRVVTLKTKHINKCQQDRT